MRAALLVSLLVSCLVALGNGDDEPGKLHGHTLNGYATLQGAKLNKRLPFNFTYANDETYSFSVDVYGAVKWNYNILYNDDVPATIATENEMRNFPLKIRGYSAGYIENEPFETVSLFDETAGPEDPAAVRRRNFANDWAELFPTHGVYGGNITHMIGLSAKSYLEKEVSGKSSMQVGSTVITIVQTALRMMHRLLTPKGLFIASLKESERMTDTNMPHNDMKHIQRAGGMVKSYYWNVTNDSEKRYKHTHFTPIAPPSGEIGSKWFEEECATLKNVVKGTHARVTAMRDEDTWMGGDDVTGDSSGNGMLVALGFFSTCDIALCVKNEEQPLVEFFAEKYWPSH